MANLQHYINMNQVVQSGSGRLAVDRSCSLIVSSITADDAGRYTCRRREGENFESDVYLFVLTSKCLLSTLTLIPEVTLTLQLSGNTQPYS
uniref:Immunoglobulin V-set domain-containing protein n=1 Tax=Poecilia mexicana TaxID=48701 RepID=A0A3B3YKS5_9TELE